MALLHEYFFIWQNDNLDIEYYSKRRRFENYLTNITVTPVTPPLLLCVFATLREIKKCHAKSHRRKVRGTKRTTPSWEGRINPQSPRGIKPQNRTFALQQPGYRHAFYPYHGFPPPAHLPHRPINRRPETTNRQPAFPRQPLYRYRWTRTHLPRRRGSLRHGTTQPRYPPRRLGRLLRVPLLPPSSEMYCKQQKPKGKNHLIYHNPPPPLPSSGGFGNSGYTLLPFLRPSARGGWSCALFLPVLSPGR